MQQLPTTTTLDPDQEILSCDKLALSEHTKIMNNILSKVVADPDWGKPDEKVGWIQFGTREVCQNCGEPHLFMTKWLFWIVHGQAVDGIIFEKGDQEGQIFVKTGEIKGELISCDLLED